MTPAGTLEHHRPFSPPHAVPGLRSHALDDVTLIVEPGEFVSIVGNPQKGPSTLLRLLVGLDTPLEGEVVLDGHRVASTSLRCGVVFQEHRLFLWLTVEQNIALTLLNADLDDAEKARLVSRTIALVGLTGLEAAYPHQLSGDVAQRVAIARALVTQPEALLLDDPFGALDAPTRAALQEDLLRIWEAEGITMILVTQDVEEAVYLADRVVVMVPQPGRIRRTVPVELTHPRDRAGAGFARIRDDVLAEAEGGMRFAV